MAKSSEVALKAQLDQLRQNFISGLGDRLSTLDEQFHLWVEQGQGRALDECHRAAHSLAGTGATFGCDELAQRARSLEQLLKAAREQEGAVVAEEQGRAALLLDEVRQAAREVGASSVTLPEITSSGFSMDTQEEGRQIAHEIYVLEDEEAFLFSFSLQLNHFGYNVQAFSTPETLKEAVIRQVPAAIVADIMLPDGEDGFSVIQAIHARQGEKKTPVIFMSGRNDFEARLGAVRAGGHSYFSKPFAVEALVDALDDLTRPADSECYRVLIVDDSESDAAYSALVLQQAGMKTKTVVEPKQLIKALDEFTPELILMDVYMPGCTGIELAAVIRQQPAYLGVPIVFLSSEVDRTVQLEALGQGGDDFLTKPIQAENLVESVAIRAGRYRQLRVQMARDSLTGLLNHTKILDSLRTEVARALRHKSSLCFAMLDLDQFKQVNDLYGHAVGDGVIKSLARLLMQRLRKTDMIGRYGGEEFAVIMPETRLEDAARVMDEIRLSFNQIDHYAGDETFRVAFSCGISCLPPVAEVVTLQEEADRALYKAKHSGRNNVQAGQG